MKKDLSRHANWMTTKDRLNALKATFSMMHWISQNQRKQKRKRYTKLVYSICPTAKSLDNILLSGQFNLNFKCCHFTHSRATVQVLILEGI